MPEANERYSGLLLVGDPHIEGRTPGFRKDDYPKTILGKLEWCVRYAQANRLLLVLLGDIFDKPRDNPIWLLGALLDLLADVECIGIYGNHDCAEPQLTDNDSLSLLVKAGRIRLLDDNPWRGRMNGRAVIVGGTSYRRPIPESFAAEPGENGPPLVFWITHHDFLVPGYEEQGRIKPRAIDRIDWIINGHIHRRLEDLRTDGTLWLTPGNISRTKRSDATREHVPAVLRIDIGADGASRQFVEVPHSPFEEVFHPVVVDAEVDGSGSAFVAGLAELQARRTASGAGLLEFLERNLGQFESAVAEEIRTLAREVTSNGEK